jgi:phosphoribosylformylglycinamidine synthase
MLVAGSLVWAFVVVVPAPAEPEACPPVCDQIPNTAWIGPPRCSPVGSASGRTGEGDDVARVIVSVMPKAEILDPQGQAIVGALGRLGHPGISDVRQGKRFELEIDDSVDDTALAEIAESLLANTVIEDWTITREML